MPDLLPVSPYPCLLRASLAALLLGILLGAAASPAQAQTQAPALTDAQRDAQEQRRIQERDTQLREQQDKTPDARQPAPPASAQRLPASEAPCFAIERITLDAQTANDRAPIEVPEVVIRQDNNFPSTVNDKGAPKAYIDENGDLVSPNPQGTGDIKSQVRGGNAQNSPLISTSDLVVAVDPKVYGSTEAVVETRQIQRDLNAGNLSKTTTEVIPPAEVQTSLQSALDKAQKRFDKNPSERNSDRLDRAHDDLKNAINDGECLIQGCAPATYVSPPRPVNPTPVIAPSNVPLVPVIIPEQAEPKQE